MFWGKFFGKFLPSFPWRVESSKIIKESQEFSKFQNSRKSLPKVSKRVLNMFRGDFLENFLPSFPWRVESSKIFKKNQKLSKFQKSQIFYQKCPNVFWTCFGANFSKKNLCPVFNGGSRLLNLEKSWKSLKNPNMPKIVPKSVQMCFEHVLGHFFLKSFMASVPWRLETSKIFEKNLKNVKIPKMFKIVRKSVQKCFGVIFSKKNLFRVFHGGSSFRKF